MKPAATQRIRVEELSSRVFSPVITPIPTAMALILDAMNGVDRMPAAGQIRTVLRRRDVEALAPLRSGWPDEICPTPPGATFGEALEQLRSLCIDSLAARIELATLQGRPTEAWLAIARRPGRWLGAYVEALLRAWSAISSIWTSGTDVLDREVERVTVALARGAQQELLPHLHVDSPIVDGEWCLPAHSSGAATLRAGEVVRLVPLLAPTSMEGWGDNEDDVITSIRYSAGAWWRSLDSVPAAADALSSLVGPQRSLILTALDRPLPAAEVAELLYAVPSAATHHARALESAGLVNRTRQGRNVFIARTARGDALLRLYGRK